MDENLANRASLDETESSNLKDMPSDMPDADFAAHVDKINAQVQARNGVANRVCGECTACCTIMAVAELNKANYQPCPHNCGSCAIYDSRPRNCRSWCCSWLLGRIEGDEQRRPDKLGLMFTREKLAGKPITVAFEVWPGAGSESHNANLLREMSQRMPIVLREYQTRKCSVFTPHQQLRQHICRLIQDDWCHNWYSQVVVTNFHATQ